MTADIVFLIRPAKVEEKTLSHLRKELRMLTGKGRQIVLDFSAVELVNTACAGLVLEIADRLRRMGETCSLLPEEGGCGFHVHFPDLPEALIGGSNLEETITEAADRLAEAISGGIVRGDETHPALKAEARATSDQRSAPVGAEAGFVPCHASRQDHQH